MPNVVKIELQMDENGVVTGFRTLDGAATKVATTLKVVGTAGTQMGAQVTAGANAATKAMQGTAAAATQMGATGAAAMKHVGDHALTSLDSVRLFRDEFGIHIPRSMEKTMAQSKAVMTVLNSMQTTMIAFGGIGVGIALGSEFYKIGKEIFKADDAVQEFNKHLAESAHQKFMDTASIEDARDQIKSATRDLGDYDRALAKVPKSVAGMAAKNTLTPSGIMALAGDPISMVVAGTKTYAMRQGRSDVDEKRNQAQKDRDTLSIRGEDQRHKQALANLEVESKKAAGIYNPAARAKAELDVAQRRGLEDAAHTRQSEVMTATIANRGLDANHQIHVSPTAGEDDRHAADALAQAEADDKLTAYARERNDELRRLSREGNDADLRGFQLMEAQKKDALDDFVRKYGAAYDAQGQLVGAARQAQLAINKRFAAEEKRASDELTAELQRNAREAALAGMTGIPAIEARNRSRDQDITDQLNSGKFAAAGDRTAQEAAANKERAANQVRTHQEMEAEEKRFADTIDGIADASNSRQAQGFARITAETKKQLDDLQKKFDEVYGSIADKTSPEYLRGLAELNKGQAAVQQGGKSQTADLARKNADETAKIEAEAYRSSLPAMKQHEQEIYDTYNERKNQYLEMLNAKEIGDEDYERRLRAAEKKLNADLAADAKAQREKIASELEPFMGAHPLEALERFGAKQASEIAAGYVQHLGGGGDVAGLDGKGKKSRSLVDMLTPGRKGVAAPGAEAAAAVASMTLTATTVNLYTQGLNFGGGGGSFTASASPSLVAMGDASRAAMTGSAIGGGFGMAAAAASTSSGGGAGGGFGVATPESSIGGTIGSAVQMGQSAADLGKQLFGKDGIKMPKALSTGKTGAALNKAGAGAGLFSAFESDGGVGGAFSGASSGAQFGSLLGGPVGAAIGAVAGGLMGALGFGGGDKAKKYDKTQIRPHIAATEMAFEMGQTPYQAAYDDLHALEHEAQVQTKQWGPGGVREYDDHIKKEFSQAFDKLNREQKAGRSQFGMNAAQFDSGGLIRGFGDFATSSTQGWMHAKIGETVMHEGATETHGDALALMLAHASREQMASYYASTTAKGMAPSYRAANQQAAFGGGNPVNNYYGHTIHAIDAKGVADVLMQNKHAVRAAQNASYAENSGGADLG